MSKQISETSRGIASLGLHPTGSVGLGSVDANPALAPTSDTSAEITKRFTATLAASSSGIREEARATPFAAGQPRFEANTPAGRTSAGIPLPPGAANHLTLMIRSTSQVGFGGASGSREPTKRSKSQRGNNRGDNVRTGGFPTPANQTMISLESIAPLEQSEDWWITGSTQHTPQQIEARALIDHKVKLLLHELTMDKFDSITDQIIEYANKSEQEKNGSTLMQVTKLIFEKAKEEVGFSEMYPRLCRKMMERVSSSIQDETIQNAEGQPITGGQLFRKYLLNRCQEDFERGWSAKEAAAASQANGEATLYSNEYYAAAKARCQGLGLVRFIGELFKQQMLTERIMHECIKKLLSNVVNPEEEEIESLCMLLTTVGQNLDNAKARNYMDIYFERMQEMARGGNINSRMQFMLQDVIELRQRHWQARSATAQPSNIAAVHEQAKRDEAAFRNSIQWGGSRRGEYRGGDHGQQTDGWNVAGGASAARPPAKVGGLSQFGKISKSAGLSFDPTSVFNKKDPKARNASLSHANSNMNMFAALGAAGADGPPQPEAATASRGGAGSREPSVDLGSGGAPAVECRSVRKRLNLLPSAIPTETEVDKGEDEGTPEPSPAPSPMSEADAQKKVKEDIKARLFSIDRGEYLGVENIGEAIMALETLPTEHHHIFVDKMAGAALDGGNKVVVLAEKLFTAIHKQQACSAEAFERGLLPTVEMADDMTIDVPKTYEWLARLIHAAGMERAQAEELAGKISALGEPRDLLMQEFDKTTTQPVVTPTTTTPSTMIAYPASISTPRPKKSLDVHALHQDGGGVPAPPPTIVMQALASTPAPPSTPSSGGLESVHRDAVIRLNTSAIPFVPSIRPHASTRISTPDDRAADTIVDAMTDLKSSKTAQPSTSSFEKQPQMDSIRSESPASLTHSERNNLMQHNRLGQGGHDGGEIQLPAAAICGCAAEQTTDECIRTINVLQRLPEDYRSTFIEKSIAAAFDGGSESVATVERILRAAYSQRICAPKQLENGFLPAVKAADDTYMDLPRTYEWLARLMHAAGLSRARVERLAERITVVGEPRVQPKYLLVYEFEKLSA
ncbi:hypothetical protein FRC07_006896 [Ceratobasidium sp. 392]|nr:hypothetical protein FRC07_006896 [Ceratobasidium sp. 392]